MTEQLSPAAAYVPPAVRICASYPVAGVGGVVLPGHPESVEIEVAEVVAPHVPAGLVVFITTLVDALFHGKAEEVVVNGVAADPCCRTEAADEAAQAAYPVGGRVR